MSGPGSYFAVQAVDDQTGRGVPLVELRTPSNVCYYTDSAGFAAIDDPNYMGRTIYFKVSSHGYADVVDGYGFHGVSMDVSPGGSVQLRIHRLNIAERLYRITGEGIYRDSVMLGRPVPIEQPLLNAQVVGQDSAQPVVYHGKIHWFWGDTCRLGAPLGHFGTAGAVSDLPGHGGLDPSVGINLHYFVDAGGFSRPMVPVPNNCFRWVDAVTTVKDDDGNDRLVARVLLLKNGKDVDARQLLMYDDATDTLKPIADIPPNALLEPLNFAVTGEPGRRDYAYFARAFPNVRVRADLRSFEDLSSYEAFTCLAPGTRYDKDKSILDRDPTGKLVWAWKKQTDPLDRDEMAAMLKSGRIRPDEVWFAPRDVETKKLISIYTSSVSYNEFRRKWIMIGGELDGSTSMVGEIWYSEADQPEGPWVWARKIVTHDRHSFYNPVHDAFFDQAGGRLIYFEGTYDSSPYAAAESRPDSDATPRYDYNQIMYRLDLSDPRLALPAVSGKS